MTNQLFVNLSRFTGPKLENDDQFFMVICVPWEATNYIIPMFWDMARQQPCLQVSELYYSC